ncbi:MAG: penicillin-binding protein activator [Chromatiales bacterium]|jgi:outer membrane PBP1 activator LpoA protein|nr:penicillin-binding protein activator [Chromatiales bacterium]MDX9767224.1 penicillin-binding protein activator [Ectothiorhodospiraceae bacterium]
MSRIRNAGIASALILLSMASLGGCGPALRMADEPMVREEQAEVLLRRGDRPGAAAIYMRMAERAQSPQREQLQLRAVELTLTPGTLQQARQYLNRVDDQTLDREGTARKALLASRLALLEGQPAAALTRLPPQTEGLSHPLALAIEQTRFDAQVAGGQGLASIEQRIQLERLQPTRDAIDANRRQVWEALRKVDAAELALWSLQASSALSRGWIDLAYVANSTPPKLALLEDRLTAWRARYPNHPAYPEYVTTLRSQWQDYQRFPRHIAVLLPLSGRFADVGNAILEGMLGAYYIETEPGSRPMLNVYDAGESVQDGLAAYRRALADGAGTIVGPLDKTQLAYIAAEPQTDVAVLGLNTADEIGPPPPQFYQFGLSPEDESRRVAELAATEGYFGAVVLAPEGEWGLRLARSFRERFEMLGGQVLAIEYFDGQAADHGAPISRALQLNESRNRHRQLQSTIGRELQFEPRRRPDADFVFVAASPRQARLLLPQLRFHHATDLPVLATSHVYTGLPDARADADLDGLVFCDMPWLLDGVNPRPELKRQIEPLLSRSSRQLPRLVALGMDAYQMIPMLPRLDQNPVERLSGLTGRLGLDDHSRVHRELACARFVRGVPRVLQNREALAEPVKDDPL